MKKAQITSVDSRKEQFRQAQIQRVKDFNKGKKLEVKAILSKRNDDGVNEIKEFSKLKDYFNETFNPPTIRQSIHELYKIIKLVSSSGVSSKGESLFETIKRVIEEREKLNSTFRIINTNYRRRTPEEFFEHYSERIKAAKQDSDMSIEELVEKIMYARNKKEARQEIYDILVEIINDGTHESGNIDFDWMYDFLQLSMPELKHNLDLANSFERWWDYMKSRYYCD